MTTGALEQERNEALLTWYRVEARDLPWRETSDPYKILVSDERPAGRVDQDAAGLHQSNLIGPHEGCSVHRAEHMQADDIRLGQQARQWKRLYVGLVDVDELIKSDHPPKPEAVKVEGSAPSDAAKPDNARRQCRRKAEWSKLTDVPNLCLHQSIGLRNATQSGKYQSNGVERNRFCPIIGHRRNDHSLAMRCGQIDVVVTNALADDGPATQVMHRPSVKLR